MQLTIQRSSSARLLATSQPSLATSETIRFDLGLDAATCPLCNGSSRKLFRKSEHWIRECELCGHRYAKLEPAEDHIELVYDDDYFMGDGAGYPDYLADGGLLVSHGKRYARLLSRHMEPGSVLDVGAAAGFILKGLVEEGWSGAGIEPNRTMAEHARTQLGLTVEATALEDFRSDDPFDLITMIQVISHFRDPREVLNIALGMTKPGGYWLIESWNRESWTARVFGKAWHEYNPPSVLHWFSIESLRVLVQDFGLREVAHGRPTKWISPSHAKLIAHSEQGENVFGKLIGGATKLIPERFLLPYMLDDVFWALYRKPEVAAMQ